MERDTIYKKILNEKFNISYLRPYQELIINHIVECDEMGRESSLLGILPTGGGKSLCFMLPIILLKKTTIIIYPLLSLMKDQETRFKNVGITYEVIKGGMSGEERRDALDRLFKGESLVLITNIEMLSFLVDSKSLIPLYENISMIVIDEAHTVHTWGNTFRKEYKNIQRILNTLKAKHILAFTATSDREIQDGIISSLFNSTKPYIVRASANRENIFYYSIIALNKREEIKRILTGKEKRPAIIFTQSRKLAERLAEELRENFNCDFYHAGMSKDRKSEIEKWFSKSIDGVLVATIAYGMGVDVGGVRTVIHYSMPDEATSFIQESGRCGRDGRDSESYVLSYPWEESTLKDIFIGEKCIRNGLLEKLDEEIEETNCLACNHCIKKEYMRAGEREIIRFIKRRGITTKQKVIRKLSSKNIFSRHRALSTWSEKEICRAMEILILEGKIKMRFKRYLIAI